MIRWRGGGAEEEDCLLRAHTQHVLPEGARAIFPHNFALRHVFSRNLFPLFSFFMDASCLWKQEVLVYVCHAHGTSWCVK